MSPTLKQQEIHPKDLQHCKLHLNTKRAWMWSISKEDVGCSNYLRKGTVINAGNMQVSLQVNTRGHFWTVTAHFLFEDDFSFRAWRSLCEVSVTWMEKARLTFIRSKWELQNGTWPIRVERQHARTGPTRDVGRRIFCWFHKSTVDFRIPSAFETWIMLLAGPTFFSMSTVPIGWDREQQLLLQVSESASKSWRESSTFVGLITCIENSAKR